MERTAACPCRQLSIKVAGEPKLVTACSCTQCQRRTGSVFSYSAQWTAASVLGIFGQRQIYERVSGSGRKARQSFCPNCGSTVFSELDVLPDHVVIAVGAFADPSFAPPSVVLWSASKHPWVGLPREAWLVAGQGGSSISRKQPGEAQRSSETEEAHD